MALITPDELRAHVETDLSDTALDRVIDAEEFAITSRYGPHTTATEQRIGGTDIVLLRRAAQSIVSVTEDDTLLVADDDYRLATPWVLERVNGDWGTRVTIVSVPVDESAQRTLALINLCKLHLAFSGYRNLTDAAGGETPESLMQERERILRALAPRKVVFA